MFRRRTAEPVAPPADEISGSGKGRPTPTRKEAEAARQARVKPQRDSKAAKAREREQQSDARAARRAGVMAGDERYLPARDQGPVRAFVRNYIDRRRRIGELVLPGAVVVLILGFIPSMAAFTYLAFYVLLLAVITDAIVVAFTLPRAIRSRFPDESGRGHAFYAVMRSLQLRRLRIPKPQVRIGDPL